MLKNAALDAKIGVDPAENEPRQECWVVAERPAGGRRSRRRAARPKRRGATASTAARQRAAYLEFLEPRQILAKFEANFMIS